MTPFEMVEAFNREVIGIDRTYPHRINAEEMDWLENVLHEERSELDAAWSEGDTIGQIDALIDSMYFAMGGLTRLGVTAEQSMKIFKVVHECNMAKAKGNKNRGSDLDAVKPETWVGPEAQITKILEGK